jgi:hypothetical protein
MRASAIERNGSIRGDETIESGMRNRSPGVLDTPVSIDVFRIEIADQRRDKRSKECRFVWVFPKPLKLQQRQRHATLGEDEPRNILGVTGEFFPC